MKYIYILITICFLLTFVWFRQGRILGGGDAGLAFYSPSIALNLSKTTWVEYGTGGATLGWLPSAGLLYFYSILENIGIPNVILQASYFFIILLTGVLSVYFFSLFFLKEKNHPVSLIAALFYLFNPFTMSQIWARGQPAQQASFALLPLALLLFALGLKKKSLIFSVLIALASLLFSWSFGYLTFVIVFWIVLFIYLLFNRSNFGILFFGITFILWTIVNSWWLMPLFSSSGNIYSSGISGSEENLGTLLGVSRNFPPDMVLRLLHKTYFFDPSALSSVYSSFFFQSISILLPVFLTFGLIKFFRNRPPGFGFYIFLLILGLTVSLGANPPFGWLFIMLFKGFPVLQAFRNPFEKFGLVYALGYSLIFSYGLVLFFEKYKYKKFAIATVLILICGIFAWPVWTGRVIAGPDQKIGLSVPTYYNDLNEWFKENNGDERVMMAPLWSGDGAFYQWGESRYQGSDPMIYLLDQPTISNTLSGSFSFEYISGIRKYLERMNLAAALKLLRVKYLVNRQDAVMLMDQEKQHSSFLTEAVYAPSEIAGTQKICQDQFASSSSGGAAWIVCQVPVEKSDISGARYLVITLKTDVSAFLDILIRDINNTMVRWDGRIAEEYRTKDDNFTKIILPLGVPTEYNSNIDYRAIQQIIIQARQQGLSNLSAGEIVLKEITVNPGLEEKINMFHLIKTFGNLQIFEPNGYKAPPEFGTLSSLVQVANIPQLFEETNRQSDQIDKKGFIVVTQNPEKNLTTLLKETEADIAEKQKYSNTRYWLKLAGSQEGLILLSKTFDNQWKLIPGVVREEVAGNLFADLALLKKDQVTEDRHFVVNGYANLWKVDGSEEYAIIYKPQVIADIGAKISKYSLFLLSGVLFLLLVKRYVKKYAKKIR